MIEPTPIFREAKAARTDAWMDAHPWAPLTDPHDKALHEHLGFLADLDRRTTPMRDEVYSLLHEGLLRLDTARMVYGYWKWPLLTTTPPASIVKGLSI